MSRFRSSSARGVLVLVALAGCRHDVIDGAEHLPQVKVLALASRVLQTSIPIHGVLAPLPGRHVKVGALVSGRVDRMFVAEGEAVRVGQPLAHVEAQAYREHVAEAEAQKTSARAAVENARTRLARSEKLWKDGITSRQEIDDARTALVAAESALRQAAALGGSAGMQLDRATLRAPIAGVVAAILVPAGQPVDGNGTPVVEVADLRELDLRAPVPSGRIGEVAVGQKAQLTVEGIGEVSGEVDAIAPMVDTATNTVIVRVKLANPGGRIRAGMFARGVLRFAPHHGLAVPTSALLPGERGAANRLAIVLPDGKVTHRDVVVGAELEDGVEIVSGVVAGERVVVAGGYSLPDGTLVEIVP